MLCSSFSNIIRRIKHKTQRPAPPLKRKLQILSVWVWSFITHCVLLSYLFIFRICLQEKSSPTLAIVFSALKPTSACKCAFRRCHYFVLKPNTNSKFTSNLQFNTNTQRRSTNSRTPQDTYFPNDIWRCDASDIIPASNCWICCIRFQASERVPPTHLNIW